MIAKKPSTLANNISLWFALVSPVLGILTGFLALFLFHH